MGCCNKNKKDDPDNIEPCCFIRNKRCMCLPYDDVFVIASQIMAIIAASISWVWWVTFVISIIGLVLFQLPWCCRQSRGAMYASVAVALVSSFTSLGIGIFILIKWKYKKGGCNVFAIFEWNDDDDWNNYNDDYHPYDRYYYCEEKKWGAIAIVCGCLWFAVAFCMFYFAKSGRHAKWEEHYSKINKNNDDSPVAVELGSIPESPLSQGESSITTAVLASETGKVDITD